MNNTNHSQWSPNAAIDSSWLGEVVMVVQRIFKGTSKIPSSINVVQQKAKSPAATGLSLDLESGMGGFSSCP